MIARIRKAKDGKDEGFTLIELLVVIIIIGILAAIAIPVYMNQRKKAVDSSIKSDLKSAASTLEVYLTDNNAYPADDTAFKAMDDLKISTGDKLTYTTDGEGNYCLLGSREATAQAGSHDWVYESWDGGLQDGTVTACEAFPA